MKRAIISFMAIGFISVAGLAAPQPQLHKKIDLKAELTGHDDKKLTEDELYVEVLSRYQSNRLSDMTAAGTLFVKKYPESTHADNVLYLLGYNALERKKYSEALRNFDSLVRKYPLSNKAVSAEFAKGTVYKQMKLNKLARNAFLKVRKKYPRSPEFFRAESEIKFLMTK